MSTSSGATTQPAPTNDAAAHLAGAKALLAKKMAQKDNPITVSPTDNMMTPTTAKISQVKKKHFTKGKPISGPRFGVAVTAPATSQKLEDGEDIADPVEETAPES